MMEIYHLKNICCIYSYCNSLVETNVPDGPDPKHLKMEVREIFK